MNCQSWKSQLPMHAKEMALTLKSLVQMHTVLNSPQLGGDFDAIFAPGDAAGDSIQQLQLIAPDSGDVLTVTGILAYSLVDGVLECTSDQVPSVVPLPVIEPTGARKSIL